MKKIINLIFIFIFTSNIVYSQYEAERHSTNYYDAWLSCEQTTGPIEKWGDRHWIMYEFDAIYVLGQMGIWNYNDRENNGFGVRDVIISYSIDGDTWIEWGLYTFEKAGATSFYQGDVGPDFDGIEARFILLTILSNYGGGSCTGIGEVKIETTGWSPTTTKYNLANIYCEISPNPVQSQAILSLKLKSLSKLNITIIDQEGRRVGFWEENPRSLEFDKSINTDHFVPGTYFVYINQNNKVRSIKLYVVK